MAEAQLLKWTNKWVFNTSKNDLVVGRNYFHPASPDDFHPASWRKIRLWYLTFGRNDYISHLLKLSCNRGRYSWSKPRKTNLRLLTGMPWLPLSVLCHDRCWVEFHPASLSEGLFWLLHSSWCVLRPNEYNDIVETSFISQTPCLSSYTCDHPSSLPGVRWVR